jgi:hypothetical protein
MRRGVPTPIQAEGQQTDVVARIISSRAAARRCSDAADEIFPARDEAARHTPARDTPARDTPGANARRVAIRRTPDHFTLSNHSNTA